MTDPARMQCAQCDSEDIDCISSTGAVDEDGRFTEKLTCNDCGATGSISGRTEHRQDKWRCSGELFS
jgi:hypothetical protein